MGKDDRGDSATEASKLTAGPQWLRQLGIVFGDLPVGKHNAITDVEGVRVGHVTVITGDDIRTGVTAVLPRADFWRKRVQGAAYTIHGNGQLTGGDWINTCGLLESPLMLTNTLSVGDVYTGVIRHMVKKYRQDPNILPIVTECYDGYLNNINALAVTPDHAEQAIMEAKQGPVSEGTVGAGTGMRAYDFKGGIGTSSRLLPDYGYTVGVLANSNGGKRTELLLHGRAIKTSTPLPSSSRDGSFVFIVATDAPLRNRELLQLSKRVTHGLARTGIVSAYGSGEFVVAFSTAEDFPPVPPPCLNQLFQAVIDATTEAIWNSLTRATSTTGYKNRTLLAIPLLDILASV